MEAKVKAEIQAIIETTPGVHKVSDAWYIRPKTYVLFATENGYPLQYNWKRIGYAKSVADIKAFLATDYTKELGKLPTSTPKPKKAKEAKVKNVFLNPEKMPAETHAKAVALGIQNIEELYAKGVLYKVIGAMQPAYRAKHDPHNHWVDAWLKRLGVKVATETTVAPATPQSAETLFDKLINGEKLDIHEYMVLQKAGLL